MNIKQGFYRHYKGKTYMVLSVAKHSETLEDVVIYRALYTDEKFGDYAFWVRPASMFIDEVEVDGNKVPRFSLMSLEDAAEIMEKEITSVMESHE
jgi:hypothetical protein